MINIFEVNETNKMIEQDNLDVRTITMGISLLDCISDNVDKLCDLAELLKVSFIFSFSTEGWRFLVIFLIKK